MSETPVHRRPRRLANWINPTDARKVHSLIDKVYQRKSLEMVRETVKANRGSGGVDGQSLDGFAAQLNQQLDRLQSELKEDVYRRQPLLNRLEPIFKPVFGEANFGYRRGLSTKDATRKVWKVDHGRGLKGLLGCCFTLLPSFMKVVRKA